MMTTKPLPVGEPIASRHAYIDWLRVFAVILLVVFHTAMIFNSLPWFIKNSGQSYALGVLVNNFLYTWHMPLFMLLAGMSTWFALCKRSGRQFLAERFTRIFLPFGFGVLLIVPPQVYYQRLQEKAFAGSYLDFYPTIFTTGLYPQGNFVNAHLWFLEYLFVFVLITLPLFLYLRGDNGQRLVTTLAARLAKPGGLLFLFPLPLAVVYTLLAPISPLTYDIFNDWAHFVWLLYAFVAGYLLVADPQMMPIVDRVWRLALVLGTVLSLGFILYDLAAVPSGGVGGSNSLISAVSSTLFVFSTWFWLVAFLGLGRAFLNRSSRFLRYASDIAYPYYILHETVIVMFGYYVVQWDIDPWLKFGMVLIVSFLLTALLCELVKLTNVTRFIFGMKSIPYQPTPLAPLKPKHP